MYSSGIGKYINPRLKKEARKAKTEAEVSAAKKEKSGSYSFSDDFSAW